MPNRRRSISVCANRPRIEVRAGGWSLVDRDRCYVGHVRHDGPPGQGLKRPAPPGDPGAQVSLS